MKAEIMRKGDDQQEQSSESKKRGEKQKPHITHRTHQILIYLNLSTLLDFFVTSQNDFLSAKTQK